jgi:predicted acetyltransferase
MAPILKDRWLDNRKRGRPMAHIRDSDSFIVLRGRESRTHGEGIDKEYAACKGNLSVKQVQNRRKSMSSLLVEPSKKFKKEYIEMIEEWSNTGERMVPFVLRYDYSDFEILLKQIDNLKHGIGLKENTISSSTFWFLNTEGIVIGAVNIRHSLNDQLMHVGGHIGYGIRPSMRLRGYATELLKQSLGKAKEMNITRALLTCDKANVGSAKTIINNGGILDSEDIIDGTQIQRYWINIE